MKHLLTLLIINSSCAPLFCASRLCLDPDYAEIGMVTRSIDPEAKLLVANILNMMVHSVYAGTEEDKKAQMQEVNNVLGSVANVVQLFINRADKRSSSFMNDEEITEFLNQPIIKELIIKRLKTERHSILKVLKKLLLTVHHRA